MRNLGKKRSSGGGSPSWMTTYADMVTLLLCFFVLLYSFSVLDVQKFQAFVASLQGALGVLDGGLSLSPESAVGSPPSVLDHSLQISLEEIAQLQDLYDLLMAMREAGQLPAEVELTVESRGLIIRFADQVFFDLGRANLTEQARAVLNELVPVLRELPNPIRVEGHTDNLPIRNQIFPSNWELSTARATSVIRFLIEEHGFSPTQLSASGYGEYRPVADNSTDSGRARNRRVDIVILRLGLSEAEPVGEEDLTVDSVGD
ncbi:MAG: flagellar motor protein MotB [Firmicutes bacterium]|nr:flagellar motor protein MotB [Bacillota bacterium]